MRFYAACTCDFFRKVHAYSLKKHAKLHHVVSVYLLFAWDGWLGELVFEIELTV